MGRSVVGSVAVVLLLAISPASAGLVLDQHQDIAFGKWGITNSGKFAQTFTAGLSGSLDQIEVHAADKLPGSVDVSITDVSGGYPGSTTFGTGSIAKDALGWTTVFFPPSSIVMSAGTMYAIVLTPATSSGYFFSTESGAHFGGDPYAYGQGLKYASGSWAPLSTTTYYDFAFKTYVETSPTPLPGAAVLGVLGLGFSGGLLRRRRPTA